MFPLPYSLEFDRVREALAALAATPLGRARALGLEPAVEPDAVAANLALTAEAARFVADAGSLSIAAPDTLVEIVAALAVADRPLDPLGLVGLARFLESVAEVTRGVMRLDTPRLAALVRGASSFEAETAAIARAIEPSGDVSDRASPALREIRDAMRRQRAKLRHSLEGLARGRETAKYLQDQIVTDRDGRYVLVVRSEHRDAIPGIVHGSSTSGASVYLEPLATVALNNEVVTLAERERAEIHRILSALTDAFRLRETELLATADVAAAIDELSAKAAFAHRTDGVAPELSEDGGVEFIGARHPLLIPAIRDLLDDDGGRTDAGRASVVVASDLVVRPPARALVISGPNTGGKTVALKAMGLLAVMAQAGMLIPVEPGSRFTPFRSIFADIGDEQSIAASLSTFSAHIANLVAMDRALERPALVLLDEVGGGTDPLEGGALGAAIVEHFRRRGALIAATTHDDTLKSYAATTAGVITAGFGFHPETYAPTYRLLYGAPGRSLAFEIAQRLGMPDGVIADARARLSGRESQLSAHLARLDRELAALDRDRQALAAERQTAAASRAEFLEREARLAEREAVMKRRLDERLGEKMREARAEVDQIIADLKQKAAALADQASRRAAKGPILTTGELGSLGAGARAALGEVSRTMAEAAAPPALPLDQPPAAGQSVFVPSFHAEGIVRNVSGKHVEVDVKGKRVRVNLADLRRAPGQTDTAAASTASDRRRAGGVSFAGAGGDGVRSARELVVIGSTVDEAISRAEKFLDDAILADEKTVRVVHGHGTGRLREALTKFFREHPLVAAVSPAPEREGGTGATIVELKD